MLTHISVFVCLSFLDLLRSGALKEILLLARCFYQPSSSVIGTESTGTDGGEDNHPLASASFLNPLTSEAKNVVPLMRHCEYHCDTSGLRVSIE